MAKKLPKPHAQNTPKIVENSSSPPQKSIPKLPKIERKAVQNRGLEGIPLEIVFPSQIEPLIFHSWGRLGAFWGRLGRLGAVLAPSWESWGVLGASWGRLEASWERLGAHFFASLI